MTMAEGHLIWEMKGAKWKETEKACVRSLTLQSSQHCPWAHTASPLRVHVVALQHGFIHSWNKRKKQNGYQHVGLIMFCHLVPVRSRLPGQRSVLPVRGISVSFFPTWRPLSGDINVGSYVLDLGILETFVVVLRGVCSIWWPMEEEGNREADEEKIEIKCSGCDRQMNGEKMWQCWPSGYHGHEQEWDLKALKRCRLQTLHDDDTISWLSAETDKREYVRSWNKSNAIKDFKEVLQCLSFIGCLGTSSLFSK